MAAAEPLATQRFTLDEPGEAVATIAARCDRCAWDVAGREAVVLRVSLDGRYAAHVPLLRQGTADYQVMLGPAARGRHTLQVEVDRDASAAGLREAGSARIEKVSVAAVAAAAAEHVPLALAPIVYARPNTIGRFTDVPAFMYYEREPTARGTRYRYTIIFTNEDGGTPTDRLMATWGRTTDIEYVYSAEVDAAGTLLADDFQGPEHETLPFRGAREGRHPLLWVSTDNNMLLDRGSTRVRYAPAPVPFPLDKTSREAVMDAHPWLYRVAALELIREGKIVANAPPGTDTIPDPRRFAYLEACGEVGSAALAFEVNVGGDWIPTDRGVVQYRIVRDGCFRAAVPLPDGTGAEAIRGVRAAVYARPPRRGEPSLPPGPVRLDRLNTLFLLDERYEPGPPLLRWTGPALVTSAAPLELGAPAVP